MAEATRWADAVPDGATVLLAVVTTDDAERLSAGEVLAVLSRVGLGCPSTLPPSGCTVAAAVGRKGESSWYATHAAAEAALAISLYPRCGGAQVVGE